MTEVTIPWQNVNLRKLTIGLQLHIVMDAFDYTTNGVTMHAHSWMTPANKDQLIWVNS